MRAAALSDGIAMVLLMCVQGRAARARARTECQRSILSHVNDQRTCALCLYSLMNFLKQMNAPSFESCSFLM